MVVGNARSMRGWVLGVVSWALAGQVGLAQAPPAAAAPSDPEAQAAALFAAKDWAGAIEAYDGLVLARPSNAQAWFNLGAAHHALGQWQEAFDSYTQAGSAGYAPVAIATRLSRVLSRWGSEISPFPGVDLREAEGIEKRPPMTLLTLDLDPETEAKLEQAAKASGLTTSYWVAELIRERTSSTWPEEVRGLFGSWSDEDFPSIEEIRAGQPDDLVQEFL